MKRYTLKSWCMEGTYNRMRQMDVPVSSGRRGWQQQRRSLWREQDAEAVWLKDDDTDDQVKYSDQSDQAESLLYQTKEQAHVRAPSDCVCEQG
jgi:hypothetical protein